MPDKELLNRYATERDEASFAELVSRHLDHVYSTALRLVNQDAHLAEDVVQSVFADLARKAGSLRHCLALSGWLHTSARFAAAKLVRGEQRRRQREQAAFTLSNMISTSSPDWEQIRPLLDEAIGELSDADRDAILLRFFEKKPYVEVGAALGLSENTARMRVDRAIDKLRSRLLGRGITSSAAAIGTALAQNLVGRAPSELGARVVSSALAAGTAASVNSAAWRSRVISTCRILLIATGVVVVTSLGIFLKSRPSNEGGENVLKVAEIPADTTNVDKRSETLPVIGQAPAEKASSGSRLRLFFVDDKTGQPITNRVIGLRGWERGQQLLVEKEVQLEQGQCVAPFDPGAKGMFWILTHLEGYADVRMRWNPMRGEVIPEFYAVRLVRPAPISGQVVDPAGNPVTGATVGFNAEELSAASGDPHDHGIDYLRAQTDAQGRWQMNRLAPEMVRRLFGGASHPAYSKSEGIYVSRQPELERQLLEGTLTFHLGEGITVSGEVVDQNGQPIPNASVRVGILNSSSSIDARTEADGRFTVKGCQPGEGIVTAEAEGHAPKAQRIKLEPKLPGVRLALEPGKPLIVRVLDKTGKPIAGARLVLQSFPRSANTTPIPQVEFRRDTDIEGRMTWINAPEQDLPFSVGAPDCMRADMTFKPDGEEHSITLQAALVIFGTVRDAVTGDLVPRFRLGMGWPQKLANGSMEPHWTTIERFWLSFTGGEFRHTLREGILGRMPNPGYVFRFEAEDHTPFITRVYQPDEGEVRLDVQLRPAGDVRVMAYTPEGKVAPNSLLK